MEGFQGIVFDIDGTAVPDGALYVDSIQLKQAFHDLSPSVAAIAATGRTKEYVTPITRGLQLRHRSIVANGAQIIHSDNGTIVWQKLLEHGQVDSIIQTCLGYDSQLCIAGDPMGRVLAPHEQTARPAAGVFLMALPYEIANVAEVQLASIPDVFVYLSSAWESGELLYDVNVSHAEARKDRTLLRLLGEYGLDASKMIAVGDGLNDIDLFSVVGHRVAVANAHPDLLALADEIIPSQQEDGLAELVSRFSR